MNYILIVKLHVIEAANKAHQRRFPAALLECAISLRYIMAHSSKAAGNWLWATLAFNECVPK